VGDVSCVILLLTLDSCLFALSLVFLGPHISCHAKLNYLIWNTLDNNIQLETFRKSWYFTTSSIHTHILCLYRIHNFCTLRLEKLAILTMRYNKAFVRATPLTHYRASFGWRSVNICLTSPVKWLWLSICAQYGEAGKSHNKHQNKLRTRIVRQHRLETFKQILSPIFNKHNNHMRKITCSWLAKYID